MKKTACLLALAALLFITGCSTPAPSIPKQHPEKYALQVIRIEVPVGEDTTLPLPDIESLLANPKAVITELPIVYAGIGETGVNDQTTTTSLPESYKLETDTNGVPTVVYSNKDVKIGKYAEMTLEKVENNTATCKLRVFEKTLRGMQTYDIAPATETQEAVAAYLPVFKNSGLNTEVTLALGQWTSMGGLIREQVVGGPSGGVKKAQTLHSTGIRIIPPQGVAFNSSPAPAKVLSYTFPAKASDGLR